MNRSFVLLIISSLVPFYTQTMDVEKVPVRVTFWSEPMYPELNDTSEIVDVPVGCTIGEAIKLVGSKKGIPLISKHWSIFFRAVQYTMEKYANLITITATADGQARLAGTQAQGDNTIVSDTDPIYIISPITFLGEEGVNEIFIFDLN